VRDPGAGVCQPCDRVVVDVDSMSEPDVVTEPAERLDVLHRRAAEVLAAKDVLVRRLGQMGVQPHALLPGKRR
jgi:hypothetical protein